MKKVRDLTKELGLTARAIRFYEDEGIVVPTTRRGQTRLYDEDAVSRLRTVKVLRDAGFSLETITRYLLAVDAGSPEAIGVLVEEGKKLMAALEERGTRLAKFLADADDGVGPYMVERSKQAA